MLIKDWMATDVLTVDEDTSLMRTTRIMKESSIRRLPVVSNGKLIGIITDRDVKDASPSKARSLDVHELYYLLTEMKVKDVMTVSPLTMNDSDSLEKAAVVMLENKISGIPIIDEAGQLVGLLSETDVLRGFIHCTGIKDGAILYVFDLDDRPGSVTKLVQFLREKSCRVISILTSFEDAPETMKRVAIRVTPEGNAVNELTQTLQENFTVVYYCLDELEDISRKAG
jgi:acetoin utilization protein AcuB